MSGPALARRVNPFSSIWKTTSVRVAVILTAVLLAIGIVGGLLADEFHLAELRERLQYLEQDN